MKINKQLIKDGYITERKHKECDYFIYNYTAKAQYEKHWHEDTMNCRGLILDGEGNVIARPFKKFFNIGEYGEPTNLGKIPNYTWFDIWDKMDGSLGILYKMPDGEFRIATRGSFESEQSKKATEMFKKMFKNPEEVFHDNLTYLFEIIYPSNRIVVDYGKEEKLVLLAVKSTLLDKEFTYEELLEFASNHNIPLTQYHGRISYNRFAFLKMENDIAEGKEGFVLKFDNGLRVKIKSEEYMRLHRIVTGLNSKSIWDMLRRGEDINEILENVPDEFYDWAKQIKTSFENNYESIEHSCDVIVKSCKFKERKEVAQYFCNKEHKIYSGVLFAMYDNKPHRDIIWKMLKPEYAKPFQEARE